MCWASDCPSGSSRVECTIAIAANDFIAELGDVYEPRVEGSSSERVEIGCEVRVDGCMLTRLFESRQTVFNEANMRRGGEGAGVGIDTTVAWLIRAQSNEDMTLGLLVYLRSPVVELGVT